MPKPAVRYTKFSDKLSDSLNDINRMINENKEMIDSIQEVALGLTDAMGTLHTLTVKYAGIANTILDALLPIVKGLPIVPKKVTNLLVNLEAITHVQILVVSDSVYCRCRNGWSHCTSVRIGQAHMVKAFTSCGVKACEHECVAAHPQGVVVHVT